MKTTVRISPEIAEQYRSIFLVAIAASGLRTASAALPVTAMLDEARLALDSERVDLDGLAVHPRLAPWRSAAQAMELSPSTFRSSTEQLVRRIARDGTLSMRLPLVGFYCGVSARYWAPIGAYDADRLPAADIVLRAARPRADTFEPLGGDAAKMPITERLVVYASASTIVCYAFNHRDSRLTSLAETTDRAIFLSEAIVLEQREASSTAITRLATELRAAGATVSQLTWLERSHPEAELVL